MHISETMPRRAVWQRSGLNHGGRSGRSSAAPNIITTDLEAYISGILHSRQKDWDAMGARRIAELWSGRVGTDAQTLGARARDRCLAANARQAQPRGASRVEGLRERGRRR